MHETRDSRSSSRSRTRAWLVAALLSLAASFSSAQQVCDGCKWAERGDRSEGVWQEASMISGGSFELMSVGYLRGGGGGSGARIGLHFWQPEAGALDEVLVWKPLPSETNDKVAYKMEPASKQFGAGPQSFAWPRGEVIDRLGLTLDSLHTRIKAGDSYIPGLLTTGAPSPAGGYAFVFESGAGIDAWCTVSRAADGEPISEFECYEEYGGEVRIEWDGRDDSGQPAADGLYVLAVEGDMLAEVLRPLETSVKFWHRGSLK